MAVKPPRSRFTGSFAGSSGRFGDERTLEFATPKILPMVAAYSAARFRAISESIDWMPN
jgi:hypothetical protein